MLLIYYLFPVEIFPVRCISLTLYSQNNYFSSQIPPRLLFFQPFSLPLQIFYILRLLILLSPLCTIILACTFIPYARVSVTH